jgi:glycosyltransferase involved in cell wall biosynthesis
LRVARLPVTTDRNPYQGQLYRYLEHHGVELQGSGSLDPRWLRLHCREVDVLHFHWRLDRLLTRRVDRDNDQARWGPLRSRLAVARIRSGLALARRLGYRIAWTVHEAARYAPDGDAFDRGVGSAIVDHADLLLVHDAVSAENVGRWLRPAAPVVVTPVGAYPASPGDRAAGRARLDADPDVPLLVAFGHHRADKRLDLVIEAFGRVDAAVRLAVVGAIPDRRLEQAVREAAGADPRITLDARRVDDGEVADLHAAADAVVLGRSRDWTPSSLLLALSHGTPVIAADLPSHHEQLGPGAWWFAPDDPESLAGAMTLVANASPEDRLARGLSGKAHVSACSFPDMAARTAVALHGACGRGPLELPDVPAVGLSST